jgi:hypothetical protein
MTEPYREDLDDITPSGTVRDQSSAEKSEVRF